MCIRDRTSGGARPKIMTEIDGEDWIIKFPAHVDGQDAGGMEYEYALCAKACGIDMTEVRLFPSKKCKGYFGIKRFDRERIVDGIGTKVKAGNKKKRIQDVYKRQLCRRLAICRCRSIRQISLMWEFRIKVWSIFFLLSLIHICFCRLDNASIQF